MPFHPRKSRKLLKQRNNIPARRIILGLDPGLASVGYGLLSMTSTDWKILDFGVLKTDPNLSLPERLFMIQGDLSVLLNRYCPTEAYIEDLFFSANRKTALLVAQARGVLLSSLEQFGVPVRTLTPNQIKLAVTGDGRATKIQVQSMLQKQFRLSSLPCPDDAADALAVAYTGALMSQHLLSFS